MYRHIIFVIIGLVFSGCSDDGDPDGNTNSQNNVVIGNPEVCMAIKDSVTCTETPGCEVYDGNFEFVSPDGTECLGKFLGSVCMALTEVQNRNDVSCYHRRTRPDGVVEWIYTMSCGSMFVGWECMGYNETGPAQGCYAANPDSRQWPFEGSIEDWYPFEGMP